MLDLATATFKQCVFCDSIIISKLEHSATTIIAGHYAVAFERNLDLWITLRDHWADFRTFIEEHPPHLPKD